MLNLPVHFDQNEWFILYTMVILISAFYWTPKLFPKQVILCIMLFHSVFGLTVDMIIGVSYPWDLYDTMDTKEYDLFDFFIYTINYPIYGYFFVHFMTRWIHQKWSMFTFIGLWVLVTACSEWISVRFNVFQYKNGWNLGFSAISYIIIFSCSAIFVKLLSRFSDYR